MNETALIGRYGRYRPEFAADPRHLGFNAAVLGRVRIGTGALLADFSVVRADGHFVTVGDDVWLGVSATIHIAHDLFPTTIGSHVTIGRNAVVHACDVADDCVIGESVVILDGSKIGRGAVIETGSVVYPRTQLEGHRLYAGSPAKPVRDLTPADIARYQDTARHRISEQLGSLEAPCGERLEGSDCFVARTASVRAPLSLEESSSVWFGCRLEASADRRIRIGCNSNVQDNTEIVAGARDVTIGADTTIGHNVSLIDCEVGSRVLLGMGSTVASGTFIQNDVLLAAGSRTEPNQVLESGWMWAGRPARPVRKLDERAAAIIGAAVPVYQLYARTFRES